LIESYIRHSLRHERRLWDRINDNIAKRGGAVQPIEQRMLNSLDRTARVAGISLESIDPTDNRHWGGKSLREKAKIVGLDSAYLAIFGVMSHNVHGAWHDLYQFHLKTDGAGGFTPNLDWGPPRPQVLFAIGLIAVDAVCDFVDFIGGKTASSHFDDRLNDLTSRLQIADHAHEAYLASRSPSVV
jgi:hypothetical protein